MPNQREPQPCPNTSGECFSEGCEATESPLWYGRGEEKKICCACYRVKAKAKRARKAAAAVDVEEECAGDTLLEIIEICGIRCAAPLQPAPQPLCPALLRVPTVAGCPSRVHRRWGSTPPSLIEQRVPLPEDEQELQYEVYGWFKFENEPEGVKALGRQWLPAAQVAAVQGFADKADSFDGTVTSEREAYD